MRSRAQAGSDVTKAEGWWRAAGLSGRLETKPAWGWVGTMHPRAVGNTRGGEDSISGLGVRWLEKNVGSWLGPCATSRAPGVSRALVPSFPLSPRKALPCLGQGHRGPRLLQH